MKKILLNLALAAVAIALTLFSCQQPIDLDPKAVYSRQAIDLMAEGERLEKEKNFQLALEKYGRALELSPRPALYYRVGVCYYALGDYDRAHDYLTRAVRLAGDYPAALYLLAKVRSQMAIAAHRSGVSPTPIVETLGPTPVQPTAGVTRPPATRTPAPTQVATAPTAKPTFPERTPAVTAERTPTTRTPEPSPRRTPEATAAAQTPRATKPAPTGIVKSATPTKTLVAMVTPPPVVTTATATGREGAPLPPLDARKVFPPVEAKDIPPDVRTTSGPLDLRDPRFHWDQAQSFYDRGLHREAADELLEYLGAQSRDLEARLLLAKIYDEGLGNEEKALEQYEKARSMFADNPKPFFLTGNFYLSRALKGQNPLYHDRARFFFSEAIRKKPDYYQAYHNMAITFMKQGNYDLAQKWFVATLKLAPEYAKAHRNYGLLLEEHFKDAKGAVRHYQEYLRLAPDASDAREVKEWIEALKGGS